MAHEPPPSFRASLKDTDTEELVDLLVHRPLAYLVARLAYPTPVTPDLITVASMLVGLLSAGCFYGSLVTGRALGVLGGLLFILSAVLDCADGQLARMRKRSTRFGRMLDGAVDAVVQIAVVPSVFAYMVWLRGGLGTPGTVAWVAFGIVAVLTGVQHIALYDQFRMVFVYQTSPVARDCDDLETVELEWRERRAQGVTLLDRLRYGFYLFHLQGIARAMRLLDPYVPPRFRDMPAYTPEGAARYRREFRGLMRAWTFFGIGTHIFLLALGAAVHRIEAYILLRGLGFNLALVVLAFFQRRASRRYFTAPQTNLEAP